jgi:predicted  nucleic acid-binding Zn-ribbon protein
MISEFQDLSDKIDRLAALTQALRHENAELRDEAQRLSDQNIALMARMIEAQRRVEALLDQLPAPAGEPVPSTDAEAAQ